jgi:hypothetical protein
MASLPCRKTFRVGIRGILRDGSRSLNLNAASIPLSVVPFVDIIYIQSIQPFTIVENHIDGNVLLELNNGFLKELNISRLSDRLTLLSHIKFLRCVDFALKHPTKAEIWRSVLTANKVGSSAKGGQTGSLSSSSTLGGDGSLVSASYGRRVWFQRKKYTALYVTDVER